MSGSLIVFSGLDGAGKSTQIELLAAYLRQQKHDVKVLWSRGGYTPGMSWLKRLARAAVGKSKLPPPGQSAERSAAFRSPGIRWCWQTLAILDLIVLYGFWVRYKRWTGTTIICDRYWQDTELDFQMNFAGDAVNSRWLWQLLRSVSPIPNASFMLLIPVDESMRRSVQKNEPFPDDEAILSDRFTHYHTLGQADPNWQIIDGTRPIEAVSQEIRDTLTQSTLCKAAC